MDTHFFFVTRMFSGLFESIEREEWNSTGIPAFVKLAETLSITHKLTWIISCKNSNESSFVNYRYKNLTLHNIDIHIIPFSRIFNLYRIDSIITNIITFFHCIQISWSAKKKLFYFDRSDIVIAALVKLLFRVPVVIRILGVYPNQKTLATRFLPKLMTPLVFFSYKVQYDLVVCTQDGSGVEYYVGKLLNSETDRKILLNGVKVFPSGPKPSGQDRISLLFVGKLIEEKGILKLIEAVAALKNTNPDFELKIIGKGHLREVIEAMLVDRCLTNHVVLLGSVSHSKIQRFYDDADVYVSVNKFGNLSNTVLEAMSAGKCIVMFGKDDNNHTDEFTEEFVPDNAVVRIDRKNIVGDLTAKLADLCENPGKIVMYSKQMRTFADEFLWSWDDRIDYEIGLLQKVAKGERIFE